MPPSGHSSTTEMTLALHSVYNHGYTVIVLPSALTLPKNIVWKNLLRIHPVTADQQILHCLGCAETVGHHRIIEYPVPA